MARPKLIVVLGTTACGKSGLGVELARCFNGEVVSADSRQVYQGLDLGTGKVTEEEMMGIPHHLLDVAQPNDIYSVADFQKAAYAAIDDILARGRNPFLVGGTGLYVRAVTEGFVFSNARPDPVLRARLEGLDTAALYALWREKTGGELTGGEENNRHRLLRALEKLEAGASEVPPRPRYDCLLLGMTYPREELCRRIDERLDRRIEDGMIQEVARLRESGASDDFLERLGLEYRYILWYLTGKLGSMDQLKDELGRAIKRFAKRQMVWFKKDRDVLWLDTAGDPLAQAAAAVTQFLGPEQG